MKKLSSYVIIGILTATVLYTPASVFALTTASQAGVQEKVTTATSAGDQSLEVTATTKVDYVLPYPGMLPDNPLYFLKQIRDWILDKLIMDPVKKAEFYILQGDKRLVMGTMLNTSGKAVLGEQVISKGEKYMYNAVQSLIGLKAKGQNVPGYLIDQLTKALAKHAEVISGEVAKAGDAEKAGLTASLNLVTQLQTDLVKLK